MGQNRISRRRKEDFFFSVPLEFLEIKKWDEKKRKKYYTKQTEQKANETWEWQKTLEGQKKEKWEIIERNLRGREEGDEKERVGGKEEREGTKSNREQKVGKEEGNYFWVSFV